MPARHRTESRTSPRRLAAADKQRQALELRKAGATFHSIAQALGYATAQGALMAVEAGLRKTLQQPADELRRLDLERLDTLLLAVWPQARQASFGAIDMVLKILTRKAKLLGLDIVAPLPGSSRDNPLWTQSTDVVDLSAATDAELDDIIQKAEAIKEAGRITTSAPIPVVVQETKQQRWRRNHPEQWGRINREGQARRRASH